MKATHQVNLNEKPGTQIPVSRNPEARGGGSIADEIDTSALEDDLLVDLANEDAYWRHNYAHQPYVDDDDLYEDFRQAYRTGYEGRARFPHREFAEVEAELRNDYERRRGEAGVPWERAKPAVRAAWDRLGPVPDDDDEAVGDYR
jgi:hypothetical protein